MNILMLTMSLGIGGAETHILELSKALVARGHKVTVASGGGLFVDPLVAAGVRHITAPLSSKKPAALRETMRILTEEIKNGAYDMIHAHARIPGFLGERLARRFDIPFITTFHGTFNPVWYWRMLTRVGEKTLAVSDDIRDYLRRFYRVPEENILVTVNGIDTASFTADPSAGEEVAREFSIPEGERILTVTRLDKESAWHAFRLIEAMPEIVSARPSARLIIVGGGDVLDEIRKQAKEMDDSLGGGRIFVLGPRGDIARILPIADVFVGVSRAAMEAMAASLPVVLSGAEGHLGTFIPALEAKAISTNFCCRGRAPAYADEIAGCVISLLGKDAEERRQMGAFNRSVVQKYYSVERMTDDAEKIYEEAATAHVPRAADVVVSGYYGFSNAGDDTLLAVISAGLRRGGIRRIAALSKRGAVPAVGVKSVSRFNIFAVRRAIKHAKLLISGGGSLFQDATSSKSLWYYASVIRLAKRMGVPVMIFANGIGPISRPLNRKIAAAAARCADYISVREPTSKGELVSMGIEAEKILVTADPVYRLAGGDTDRKPAGKIVVSLRETAGQSAKKTDITALEDAVVSALTSVCRDRSLTAVLLPLQPRYDKEICARVCTRLTEAGVDAQCSTAATAEEIFTEIASARALVGMRLHALIFATAAGVPTAAISYDPKIDALMGYLEMGEFTIAQDKPDAEKIASVLTRALTDEGLPAHLKARTAELRRLAETDIDAAARMYFGK